MTAKPCQLVRETSQWVVSQACNVSINEEAVQRLVEEGPANLEENLYTLKSFDRDLHFADPINNPGLTAQYLLVVDALNFCFWQDDELEYADLAGGIKRSITADPSIISAAKLACIDEDGVQDLLQWPRSVPLAGERARLLRELGSALTLHFNGQAAELILQAKQSAPALVSLITATLPGFRDHTVYRGRQVFFCKRAQIFVGDLYGAFEAKSLGAFHDIDELTMFADYRVPAVLRELNILEYSAELTRLIDAREELKPGSEEEVEIRAATVTAVERIRVAVGEKFGGEGRGLPKALFLDWYLWELGEAARHEHRPHHRTLTVFY